MYMWSMFTFAKKIVLICCLGLCLTACQDSNKKTEIVVETPSGQQAVFFASLAISPEQQAQGLMHVETMPENEGMLFVYQEPTLVKFWMKNTLIPLDMIFIGPNHDVIFIEKEAQPGSLLPRGPDDPVCTVLEINGGVSDKLGITVGSKIIAKPVEECLQFTQQ